MIDILNNLIKQEEKINKCSNFQEIQAEYIKFWTGIETFVNLLQYEFSRTWSFLRNINSPNGYPEEMGYVGKDYKKSANQKVILLKKAKIIMETEITDKKNNKTNNEKNIFHGNVIQNFGGIIQGDYNLNIKRENSPTILEWILKLPSFFYKLIINFLGWLFLK